MCPDRACCCVWQLGAHGRQFLGGQREGELPKMGRRVCEWQWGDEGFILWLEESGLVLKGPVSGPVQDRKKTKPRPVFQKTAVLVFQNFKRKTAERPVYMDLLRPVETGLLCPSITHSNVAQEHVNWLKTD